MSHGNIPRAGLLVRKHVLYLQRFPPKLDRGTCRNTREGTTLENLEMIGICCTAKRHTTGSQSTLSDETMSREALLLRSISLVHLLVGGVGDIGQAEAPLLTAQSEEDLYFAGTPPPHSCLPLGSLAALQRRQSTPNSHSGPCILNFTLRI